MANPEHVRILKQGVEAWNHWRRGNAHIQVDLSDTSFQKFNLAEIDLSNAYLHRTNFNQTNLTDAKLFEANLQEADIVDADMRGDKWQILNK